MLIVKVMLHKNNLAPDYKLLLLLCVLLRLCLQKYFLYV